MNLLQRPIWIDAAWLILLFGALLIRHHSEGLFCFKMFRRLFWTFLATLAGVIETFVFAICYFGILPNTGYLLVSIILIHTAYAWLFFILPLTLWFEDKSKIYHYRFSIPLGITLSLVAFLLLGVDWPISIVFIFPIFFGITVSATLSALAAFCKDPQIRAEQGAAANPYPLRS